MNKKDRLREEFDKFIDGVQANYQLYLNKLDDRTFEKKNIKIEDFWQFFQTQLQQAKKEGMIEILKEISGKDYIRYPSSPNDPHITLKSIEERLKSLTQKEE